MEFRARRWTISLTLLNLAVFVQGPSFAQRPSFRKPPPPGVVELVGLGISSVVELEDGRLLSDRGSISSDGGHTWSHRGTFPLGGHSGDGLARLQSGALILTTSKLPQPTMWISNDEGKTWEARIPRLVGTPLEATPPIQLKNGRLLWASRYTMGNLLHAGLKYKDASAYGTYRGKPYQIEGHGHIPEISLAGVSYSDDEGKTWKCGEKFNPNDDDLRYSSAILLGWFGPDGHANQSEAWVTDTDEPTIAETKDGKVLFFARSTVGRIVQSWSDDAGIHWTPVLPTNLASSYSPARLVRIPKTGDLLCVWNQLSGAEIRRGYRRGRLTAAISRDAGHSWENFKTLELSEGLDDVAKVEPEYPIPMLIRARKNVGPLPDAYAYFHYASVTFAGDKVFIAYSRGSPLLGIAEQNLKEQENVLRIVPLHWFYD
jgi:hypothetical protein